MGGAGEGVGVDSTLVAVGGIVGVAVGSTSGVEVGSAVVLIGWGDTLLAVVVVDGAVPQAINSPASSTHTSRPIPRMGFAPLAGLAASTEHGSYCCSGRPAARLHL